MELPDGACPPDQWDSADRATLSLSHVISRSKDGKPLSCVGDLVWNWTPYEPRGRKVLMYFDYWAKKGRKNINEAEVSPERLVRIRELQQLMPFSRVGVYQAP